MPRDFQRSDRIADAIHKELSQIILQELKDPRVGMITLSTVRVTKDLKTARVYITVINDEHIKETVAALNNAAGFLRITLAKRIKMRQVPLLVFVYDESLVKASRLTRLIDQISVQHKKENEEQEPHQDSSDE